MTFPAIAMTTKTMQQRKMSAMVRQQVVEVLREVMSDPDLGLELRPEFVRRLKRSIRDVKAGKIIPLSKIIAKYG